MKQMQTSKAEAIRRAQNRDRISNIFSATIAETPSFDDVELWTLIEGAPIGGRARDEEVKVTRARLEYDNALNSLSKGLSPMIAGVPVRSAYPSSDAFVEACDAAARVARSGAPIHSVVNALNLTLVASGAAPVHVRRPAARALKASVERAHYGSSDDLQKTLRKLHE